MDIKYARLLFVRRFAMRKRQSEKGFTLVELIVVTGILTLITGLMLVNNNKFGGALLLENLAYDVALSIREAQVYGISVRQFGSGNFELGYGVHFDMANPKTYSLFGDVDGNGLWAAGEEVAPSPYAIERGYFISKLCAPAGSDTESCSSATDLDLVFKRPEPDAYISADGISGVTTPSALQESARVVLESPRGDERSVVVEVTGQISVE